MSETNYIFGIRTCIEAIKSGKTIDKLMIKKGLQGELYYELTSTLKEYQISYQLVPEQKLNRITRKNHQGVIAFLSPVPFHDITEIITQTYEKGESPFVLYLDQLTDVRNFGAIVRTAECAGVHAIIIQEKGSAQITPDAVKTSAGAINHVPICKVRNGHGTLKMLRENGLEVFAATESAEKYYTDFEYSSPCVMIMGSEDTGISTDLLKIADYLVKIPLLGKIASLNVSVAAGILLFEAVKYRK